MLIGYVQTTLTVLMMGWLFDCAIQIVRGIVLRGPTMHDLRVPVLWLTVYTSATSARRGRAIQENSGVNPTVATGCQAGRQQYGDISDCGTWRP